MPHNKAYINLDGRINENIYLNCNARDWTISDINLINIFIKPVNELEHFLKNGHGLFNNSLNNKYILPALEDSYFLNDNAIAMHNVSDDAGVKKFLKLLKSIYERSIQKQRESNEDECADMIELLLSSIYQERYYTVSQKIKRSLEIGPKVVISENDIECYKHRNFTLSAELKDHHNPTVKNHSDYQLVVNLLTQAYFKFRRRKIGENKIKVFGIKVWGYKVIFYKAEFDPEYLEWLQNGKLLAMGEKIQVWKWPADDELGLALIKKEDRKKCIQLLNAMRNNENIFRIKIDTSKRLATGRRSVTQASSCHNRIDTLKIKRLNHKDLLQKFDNKNNNNNKTVKCDSCKRTFTSIGIKMHKRTCNNNMVMVDCDICKRNFTRAGIKKHKKSCGVKKQEAETLDESKNNNQTANNFD